MYTFSQLIWLVARATKVMISHRTHSYLIRRNEGGKWVGFDGKPITNLGMSEILNGLDAGFTVQVVVN